MTVLEFTRDIVDALIAIPAGLLPKAWWDRFPAIQIERFSLHSALVTLLAGFAIGIPGFLDYATDMGMRASVAMIGAGADATEAEAIAPMAFTVLTPFLYALSTPRGLFSLYLVLSGIARAASAYVDDPRGDPIASLLAAGVTRTRSRVRDRRAAAERAAREGRELPDRLYEGEWAGLPQVDYVVVASRRKPGWEAGTFVITPDKWYRLGAPFDMEVHGVVRTIYPLTALETVEVLRRGVQYELPPLSKGRPPR